MMNTAEILKKCENLKLPENYFIGQCLPEKFALPDSILMFFSRWSEYSEQYHGRHLLVIPFDKVSYTVESSRYELSAGDCLLLLPWQRHCHLTDSPKICPRLLITFELPSKQCYLPNPTVMHCESKTWAHINDMLNAYAADNTVEVSWNLLQLLSELAKNPVAVPRSSFSELIISVLRYISKNIASPLDVQTIAEHVNISSSHLRMRFRQEMKISLGTYIATQRLHLACSRLQNTNLSIHTIAESCGYTSIYAFSHFFKNALGISPAKFRNSNSELIG